MQAPASSPALPTCAEQYPYICIYLAVYISIYLSLYLSIYLSIYIYIIYICVYIYTDTMSTALPTCATQCQYPLASPERSVSLVLLSHATDILRIRHCAQVPECRGSCKPR